MAKPAAKRIGENPLDALVPTKTHARAARRSATVEAVARPRRIEKERLTVHIPMDLVGRVKNCAVALSGPPSRLTLAAFAEEAFLRELKRLEKEHNRGKTFPPRESELKGGRPIK